MNMLTDGFYRVAFQTRLGGGAGVLNLLSGKMWGGDSSLYYNGTYTQSGNDFTASVVTDRHTPGLQSVFGVDRVHISLRGKTDGASATMQGTAAEAPGVTFQATLTKIPL
jgi:hypothetical protein